MEGRGIETKIRGKAGAGEKICNFSSFTHPGQQRDGGEESIRNRICHFGSRTS